MHARDIPKLKESRKRRRNDIPEDPVVKKARLLKQKRSMKTLRDTERQIRDETMENLDQTMNMLHELLLITAGEQNNITVQIPATDGRQGKNKKVLQQMYVAAAKCRILTEKILQKHLES